MSTHLDLDDVASGHPAAQAELAALRARIAELEAALAAERERRERAEKDAERYRWLRSDANEKINDNLLREFKRSTTCLALELPREVYASVSALHARVVNHIARLEQDAARLNWLDAHPREATVRIGADMKPAVYWGVSAAPGFSMREAIDAAIAKEQPR